MWHLSLKARGTILTLSILTQEKHVFLTKLIPEGNIQYLKYIVRDDIITRNGLYMQDTLGWKVINVLGFSNYNFCYRFDSCVT
jgi:hypothetical protein